VQKCSSICPHEQLPPLLQHSWVLRKCLSWPCLIALSLLLRMELLMPLVHCCLWNTHISTYSMHSPMNFS
jgi:hypothetical protein